MYYDMLKSGNCSLGMRLQKPTLTLNATRP